jgi:hypothetical protein
MKAQVFLGEAATEDARALDAVQRRKLAWWAARLAADFAAGDHIRRDLAPRKLLAKHHAENLWRFELPGGWRGLYTVMSRADQPLTVSILRIVDHKEYDRLFGYKRS